MATYDVADRSAIVTGGGNGIGRATALVLAASGASVIVADFVEEAANAVVAEIRAAGGIAEAYVGDVTDQSAIDGMIAAANALAPLKIAVNNAGIGGQAAPVGEYSDESWLKVIDVNLNAVFRGVRAQINAMVANGGGSIINMASVLGSVGIANSSAYVTTKHALLGLTKNAALEYGTQGVRVTAVGPGFIKTPCSRRTSTRPRRTSSPASTRPSGWASRRRSRTSSRSSRATPPASSPAATTSSTAATPPSKRTPCSIRRRSIDRDPVPPAVTR